MIVFLNWLKNVLYAFIFRLRIIYSPQTSDAETENLTSSPDSEDLDLLSISANGSSTDRTIGTKASKGLDTETLYPSHSSTVYEVTTTRPAQENPIPSGTEINADTLNFPGNAAEDVENLNAGKVNSSDLKETEISDVSCHNEEPLSDSSASGHISVQSKTKAESGSRYEISVSRDSARPTETVVSFFKSETASQPHKKKKKKKSKNKLTVTKNPNTIASSGNPSQHRIPTESSQTPSTDRTIDTKAASGLNADVLCPPLSNTTHEIKTEILDFHDNAVECVKTLNVENANSSNFKETKVSDISDDNEQPWEHVWYRKQKSKAKSLSQFEILPLSQASSDASKIANSFSKSKNARQAYKKNQLKTTRNSKISEKGSITRKSNTKAPFGSSSHRRIPIETSLSPSTVVRTSEVGTCADTRYSDVVKKTISTKADVKTDLNVTEGSSVHPSVDFFNVRDNDNVITSAKVSANAENQTGDNAQVEQVNSNLALILNSQASSNCIDLITSNPYRFNPVVGLPVKFPNLSCNLYEAQDNSLRILEGEDDTFSDPFDSDFANDSVLNLPFPSLPVFNTLPGQLESQAPIRIPNPSSNLHYEAQSYLPIFEGMDTSSDSIGSYIANDSVLIPTPPSFPANYQLFDSYISSIWAPSETESTDNSLRTDVSNDSRRSNAFFDPRNSIDLNSNLVHSSKPNLDQPDASASSVSEDVSPSVVTTVHNHIIEVRGVPHIYTNPRLFPQIMPQRALLNSGFSHTFPVYPNRAFSSNVRAESNIAIHHNSAYRLDSNSGAFPHTLANRLVSDRAEQRTLVDRPVSNVTVPHTSSYHQTPNSVILRTSDNRQTLNRPFLNTSGNRPVLDRAVLHTSDNRQTIETFNTVHRDNRSVIHTPANRPVSDSVISQNSSSRSVSKIARSRSFPGHSDSNNAFHQTDNINFAAFSGPLQINSTQPSPPQRPGTFQSPPLENVYQPHALAYDNFTWVSHTGMGKPIPNVPSSSTAFSSQSFSYQSANPQPVEVILRPNSSAAVQPDFNTEQPSNLPFSREAATGIKTFRKTNNKSVTYQTYDSQSGLRTIHTVTTEVRQTCFTRQFTSSDDSPSTKLSLPDSNLRNMGGRNRHYRSIPNPASFRNRFAQRVSPPVNASKFPGKPRNQLSAKEPHPRSVNLDGPSSKPTYPNLPVYAEENEDVSGEEKHGRTRSVSEIPNPRAFPNIQAGQQSGFRRSTSYPGPRNKRNKSSITKKE